MKGRSDVSSSEFVDNLLDYDVVVIGAGISGLTNSFFCENRDFVFVFWKGVRA